MLIEYLQNKLMDVFYYEILVSKTHGNEPRTHNFETPKYP